MATQAAHRKNRVGTLFPLAIVVLAAVISFVSYAATSGGSTLTISAPDSDSGGVADITSVITPFEAIQGKGKKTNGVALAKLTMATGFESKGTRIEMLWTDPGEATGVLLNPNAFLETRLYYVSSSCDVADQRTFEDGGTITVCPDASGAVENFTTLSIQGTYAFFIATQTSQSVLYILADITVPGGAPAGQQSQLNSLSFNFTIS